MWTIFSCINCYFQIHKGINIKQFYSLVRFLKQLSARHVPKQAKAFTEKEISLYLQSAPNDGMVKLQFQSRKPIELEDRLLLSLFLESQHFLELMQVISLQNTRLK
jgi:hypothetical protein